MTSLDFLYIALGICVIVITLAIIVTTVFIVLILRDTRRLIQALEKTALKIRYWKDEVQTDMIQGVLSVGKNIFRKKTADE